MNIEATLDKDLPQETVYKEITNKMFGSVVLITDVTKHSGMSCWTGGRAKGRFHDSCPETETATEGLII